VQVFGFRVILVETKLPRGDSIKMAGHDEAILIVNCWDDSNKGDAAITIGTVNTLKASFAAKRIQVSSYVAHASSQEMRHAFRHVIEAHSDVNLVPCYFPALSRSIGRASALFRSIRCALKLMTPNLISDTPLDRAVRDAQIVISNGGLYFGFRRTNIFNMFYHLFAFSYPMLLAARLGVPYVLFSQSFGPFPSRLSRSWIRWLANHSAGTWCRESLSADTLSKLGIDASKLKVIPDAAFGITSRDNEALDRILLPNLRSGEYIAFSLRSLVPAGFSKESEKVYLDAFRNLIEWIVEERQLDVVLVAHTIGPISDEDDRLTTRAVYESLKSEVAERVTICEMDLSPQQLCTLYGNARLVVATRFHAVVLSLCGGTPVIAIPYFGVKTQGALRDMGLGSSVLEVKNIDGKSLQTKVASFLDHSETSRTDIARITQRLYLGALLSGKLLQSIGSLAPAEFIS
jgi:colanic acid/amylovoran biosynthesis protein